jgi:alpha-L-fucosidase
LLEIWEALAERRAPDWYDDAKLGIMIHWGPYAVPAWAPPTGELPAVVADKGWEYWFSHNSYAEWYANSMLIPGSPTHDRHRAKWGRISRYDAFARTFRQGVKEWDPGRWVDAVVASAARYVVFTAKHHDGFLLWPSRKRNPRKGGWQLSRDVVGELAEAVRGRGLRFGLYYSAGMDWTFGGTPIRNLADLRSATPRSKSYAAYVDSHWRELIERYSPSILWNDVGSPPEEDLARLFTDYYAAVPDGVVNDRFGQADIGTPGSLRHRAAMILARVFSRRAFRQAPAGLTAPAVRHADFQALEYETVPKDGVSKWECVRGLGCSFGCVEAQEEQLMLSASALVRLLVDVVAGGGNLLLGVGPAADGSIPENQLSRLKGLGLWLKLNGEAIFGSRPWGGEREDATEDDVPIRYTTRGMTTYAILNGTPAGRTIVLPSVRLLPYAGMRILGSLGYVTWHQEGKDVHVRLSEPLRESPAHVISMTPQPRL